MGYKWRNKMKAIQRRIDSVWTLEYEFINDHTIKIIAYGRNDPEGYDKEGILPKAILVEASGRIINFVKINDGGKTTIYQVENPKNIFKYNKE